MSQGPDIVDDPFAHLNDQPAFRLRAPSSIRAAAWALASVVRVRRRLRREGLAAQVPAPPRLPWGSRNGVNVVLRRLSPTCLERTLVMQRWLASHGARFDVVIGVRRVDGDVSAHAWLDEMTLPEEWASYTVVHRLPAP